MGGTAYQSICEQDKWNLELVDGSAYKEDRKALQQRVHELIIQPFDLARDHMVRATLIQIGEQDHGQKQITLPMQSILPVPQENRRE